MPLLGRGRIRLEERRLESGRPEPARLGPPRPGPPRLGPARFDDRTESLAQNLDPLRDPILDRALDPGFGPGRSARRSGFFETCANPRCGSGWLKLWRSRRAPVFEGGWCCSPQCMRAQVESALSRELDTRSTVPDARPHRIPLGLILLEQGWIARDALRAALDAQKRVGEGRLGAWLVRRQALSEERVTRALALQWSCPVLGLEFHRPEAVAALLPRVLVQALGALPLRVAAGRILYLGFENRPDPVLAFALERVTGLRVESGVVSASHFRSAQERLLAARFPRSGQVEVASDASLPATLLKIIEQARPVEAFLVRVHGCLWLRLWLRPQLGPTPEPDAVEDVLFSVSAR
jgi:hypothetical protein